MSNTLKQKIDLMTENELAELSLRETLSVEEAICDAADMAFLVETADLPVDAASVKELSGVGDFDKYQFFNQDQIAGIDTEDLVDLYDPDNKGGAASEGDKDLNEGMAGTIGNVNHDFVTRTAADMNNPDLGIQTTEMPDNFDEVLTGGSLVRRPTSTKSASLHGVPENIEDILGGSQTAVDKADQVNSGSDQPEVKSVETGVVDHPVGTHQNSTLKEGGDLVSFLLGESSDNAITDENGIMPDDDSEEDDDDLEGDDNGEDDEDGSTLPEDFDTDSFLASLDSIDADDDEGDDA